MGAPKWPPYPQRSGRPGGAVAPLDNGWERGPEMAPIPPSVRRAPGNPVRSSISVVVIGAPKWPPYPQRSGRPGGAVAPLDNGWERGPEMALPPR